MSSVCTLTPVLMTPGHDSRVREAPRRTQRRGSLYLTPPSFLSHWPPAPDSDQTAGSPSMAPGGSLGREVHQGEKRRNQQTELLTYTGCGLPLVGKPHTPAIKPTLRSDPSLYPLAIQTLWCQLMKLLTVTHSK